MSDERQAAIAWQIGEKLLVFVDDTSEMFDLAKEMKGDNGRMIRTLLCSLAKNYLQLSMVLENIHNEGNQHVASVPDPE